MTFRFEATDPVRTLVLMPDGARVWPDEQYDEYDDHQLHQLFGGTIEGVDACGRRVVVRGNHIARVEYWEWAPVPDERNQSDRPA